jgi:AcrR family transcriptional regulator
MSRLPAAERREQLLDSAVGVFAERGYSGATTAMLAKAAGVTEPIIYRHFRSKKELFISVIQRAGRLTLDLWESQLTTAKDPAQRLRRLIGANPMTTETGRGVYRVIVQAMTEIEDPDILDALRTHVRKLHDFVKREVATAQENGQVSKAFSPEVTAWALMHLGLGFGILAALGMPDHAVDPHHVHVRQVITKLMLGDRAKQVQNEMLQRRQSGGSASGSPDRLPGASQHSDGGAAS